MKFLKRKEFVFVLIFYYVRGIISSPVPLKDIETATANKRTNTEVLKSMDFIKEEDVMRKILFLNYFNKLLSKNSTNETENSIQLPKIANSLKIRAPITISLPELVINWKDIQETTLEEVFTNIIHKIVLDKLNMEYSPLSSNTININDDMVDKSKNEILERTKRSFHYGINKNFARKIDTKTINKKYELQNIGQKPKKLMFNKLGDIILNGLDTDDNLPGKNLLKQFLSNRFNSIVQHYPTKPSYNYGSHGFSTFKPSSFDDLSLGTGTITELSKGLDIEKRLGKLDSVFNSLQLNNEECRRRVVCEVSRNAELYYPLAEIFQHETKVEGNMRDIGRELLDSSEGTRLLTYIEASTRGKDRYGQCDIYRYSCRQDVRKLIDMDALVVWREVVGWLTVKVLAKGNH